MRYQILALALGFIVCGKLHGANGFLASDSRFEVSFPQSRSSKPLDGRVVLLLSKNADEGAAKASS